MSSREVAFKINGYKVMYLILIIFSYSGWVFLWNSDKELISKVFLQNILVYSVFLGLIITVYGNLKIGQIKSKMLIVSTSIGVVLADFFGYVLLGIMKNIHGTSFLQSQIIFFFFVTVFSHIIITILVLKSGQKLYFSMNEPLKTVIIIDDEANENDKIVKSIQGFKEKYKLLEVFYMEDEQLPTSLVECDFCIVSVYNQKLRLEILKKCFDLNIDYAVIPKLDDLILKNAKLSVIDDVSILESKNMMTFSQKTLKRLCDIFVSLILLIFTSPIMLLIAIAIKIEDRGKVFFRQQRMTKDRKIFYVIKFRSMKENVENYSYIANDDRVTKVGRIIRKTRLDELPQFINVLLGDMSVVGPRPEMLENVIEYEARLPEFAYRLKVKAGITGIAQIEGRYNSSPKDKLYMDLAYIQNYSLINDIKLMLLTLTVIAKEDSTEGFNSHL